MGELDVREELLPSFRRVFRSWSFKPRITKQGLKFGSSSRDGTQHDGAPPVRGTRAITTIVIMDSMVNSISNEKRLNSKEIARIHGQPGSETAGTGCFKLFLHIFLQGWARQIMQEAVLRRRMAKDARAYVPAMQTGRCRPRVRNGLRPRHCNVVRDLGQDAKDPCEVRLLDYVTVNLKWPKKAPTEEQHPVAGEPL